MRMTRLVRTVGHAICILVICLSTGYAAEKTSKSYRPSSLTTHSPNAVPIVIKPQETSMSFSDYVEKFDHSVSTAAQPMVLQQWRHPSISTDGAGNMARTYEYFDGSFDSSYIYINGSPNSGTSWSGCCFLDLHGASYPSIDYYGTGTRMLGTFVPPKSFQLGGAFMLVDIPDPNNVAGWSVTFFSIAGLGWRNSRAADIAAQVYPPQSWNWGLESAIMTQVGLDTLNEVPTIFGRHNNLPFGSYFGEFPFCKTTAIAIDRINNLTYAVYDYRDTTDNQFKLFLRQDFQFNLTAGTDIAVKEMTLNNEHLRYPDIVVDSATILVAASVYSDLDTLDHDIVLLRATDGDVDNISLVGSIAASSDDENFPMLTNIVGDTVGCVFIKNHKVFMSWSFDRGTTWIPPFQASASGDSIVAEYRTTHFNLGIKGIAYAQKYGSNPAIPIQLAQYNIGLPDSDADGINDFIDNCVFGQNPGQEDGDGDGMGDVCDPCPADPLNDSDGDGVCGNVDNCRSIPNSLQANSDADTLGDVCDNCPTNTNNNQADADHDGQGDLCDLCTDTDNDGFGNPGFALNTCAVDNCPYTFNPSQADADSNGVGDACGLCGDADGSGIVNISDVVFMISYIFAGGLPPYPLNSADVDCNTIVNISDVVYMINYIFSGGSVPCAACP